MLAKDQCVVGAIVAIPKTKSVDSDISWFLKELQNRGWVYPYLVIARVIPFKDTDEFVHCTLARALGENGEDGWLDSSNFSSEDLELYKPGYWDVAFRVGDVLLLNEHGTDDAPYYLMNERCEAIVREACTEYGLEVPELNDYIPNSRHYDPVDARDYYIDQLRKHF